MIPEDALREFIARCVANIEVSRIHTSIGLHQQLNDEQLAEIDTDVDRIHTASHMIRKEIKRYQGMVPLQ